MSIVREVKESPLIQGVDEVIAYIVDTSKWPGTGTVSAVSTLIFDVDGNNVSATKMTGTSSVSSADITTAQVTSLVNATRYKMEVKWTKSSNVQECFTWIDAET